MSGEYESLQERLKRLSEQAPAQAPEGWYPDPEEDGVERYWDGESWSSKRRETEAGREARISAAQAEESASEPAAAEEAPAELDESAGEVRPVTQDDLKLKPAGEIRDDERVERRPPLRDPAEKQVHAGNPYAIIAIAFATGALALAVSPLTFLTTFSVVACGALAVIAIICGVLGLIEAQSNPFAGFKSVALIGAVLGLGVLMWLAVVVLSFHSELDSEINPDAVSGVISLWLA